jgi:hypothetical protein
VNRPHRITFSSHTGDRSLARDEDAMLKSLIRLCRKTTLHQPLERLLTVRAQRALSLAATEAGACGHNRVTADHLLMGLGGECRPQPCHGTRSP